MKLCLFLTAITDILILNMDLTFSRQMTDLIDKFRYGIGLLSGNNLFKGKLEFCLRDVDLN